jgi:hypothetical protein
MVSHAPFTSKKVPASIRYFVLLLIVPVFILLTGCGARGTNAAANGTSRTTMGIDPTNDGSVQLRIGDDPKTPDGRIVALRLDISSMKLWNSAPDGASIDFLVDPISVELTHASTVTIPIAQAGAYPDTTYDRLSITYSGSAISYMNMPSAAVYNEELGPLPSQTVDLSASPISLASDPVVINVEVNVPSITDLSSTSPGLPAPPPLLARKGGTVTASPPLIPWGTSVRPMATAHTGTDPLITVWQSQIGSGEQQSQSGKIEHLVGTVTRVVGTTITVKPAENSSFTFTTDDLTNFENVTLATALNATVEVNGSTQADGSLYADEVELVDVANGVELFGLVTYDYPDVELNLVVQDGIGAGMSTSLVGKTISAQVAQSGYAINTGHIDMTGVTAVFDGEHIVPGQQVEVESLWGLIADPDSGLQYLDSPFMIELQQQTISGYAENYAAGQNGTHTFDILLPLDGSSPVANLNPGLTSIHVYQQPTTFPALSSIADSTRVQVRGLLLCQNDNVNQTCTNFVLVASKITVSD